MCLGSIHVVRGQGGVRPGRCLIASTPQAPQEGVVTAGALGVWQAAGVVRAEKREESHEGRGAHRGGGGSVQRAVGMEAPRPCADGRGRGGR